MNNNNPLRVVLLDLDGTINQSHAGIIASAKQAMRDVNFPIPDEDEMMRFVGPSILESWVRIGMPESLHMKALSLYREYYTQKAVFNDPNHPGEHLTGDKLCKVYDGIPAQLQRLRDDGYYLAIATCKPEYQALPVCQYFGVDSMVDAIFGASQDMSRIHKDEVIRYGFDTLGFNASRGDRALMVGDRWTDVDGALACNLDCLGCSWGYAEPQELQSHGAYRVIDRVDELAQAVESYFSK